MSLECHTENEVGLDGETFMFTAALFINLAPILMLLHLLILEFLGSNLLPQQR